MAWKLLICFFLFIIVNICAGKQGCPIESEIAPCLCYNYDPDQILECDFALEDPRAAEDNLRRVFRNAANYDFYAVRILSCTLSYIPHDLFKDITIEMIEMQNLTLVDLFEEAPTYLAGIKVFYISQTKLFRGIVWEHLRVMTKLERLALFDIPLKILNKDSSKHISKSLQYFALYNSGIKSFKPGVFEDFVNLEVFIINKANLKELRRDFFPRPFNSIKYIELSDLPLKTIPDGMFADMPNLDVLDLYNNQLTTLDVAVFDQRDKRVNIGLINNPLHCNCRLSYLFLERKTNFYPISGLCATPEEVKGIWVGVVDQNLHCP